MTPPVASPLVFLGVPTISGIVIAAALWGRSVAHRRLATPAHEARSDLMRLAVGSILWVALWLLVAASGALLQFDLRPPPLVLLVVAVLAMGGWLGLSRSSSVWVRGLPLWALVAFHAFRFPLELVMLQAAREGVMPIQMSVEGRNFDLLTGTTALMLAPLLARGTLSPRWARLWNGMGLLLLANVVVIAVASTPLFRAFGDDALNTWVAFPPYVLLPACLVCAALAGHLLVLRKLAELQRAPSGCSTHPAGRAAGRTPVRRQALSANVRETPAPEHCWTAAGGSVRR